MRQNHCSEIKGSIRSPERCEWGTEWTYGSSPLINPRSRSSASTASFASSVVRPANDSPASAVIRPSSPITLTWSRPWERPISKSFGSWPGVTFNAPVPNSGSTYSSAITGSRRPTSGRTQCLPIKSR